MIADDKGTPFVAVVSMSAVGELAALSGLRGLE